MNKVHRWGEGAIAPPPPKNARTTGSWFEINDSHCFVLKLFVSGEWMFRYLVIVHGKEEDIRPIIALYR